MHIWIQCNSIFNCFSLSLTFSLWGGLPSYWRTGSWASLPWPPHTHHSENSIPQNAPEHHRHPRPPQSPWQHTWQMGQRESQIRIQLASQTWHYLWRLPGQPRHFEWQNKWQTYPHFQSSLIFTLQFPLTIVSFCVSYYNTILVDRPYHSTHYLSFYHNQNGSLSSTFVTLSSKIDTNMKSSSANER